MTADHLASAVENYRQRMEAIKRAAMEKEAEAEKAAALYIPDGPDNGND